jgi:O-antigen ligase
MIGLFLTWAVFDQNLKRSLINLGVALLAVTTLFVSLSNSGFVTLLLLLGILASLVFKASNKKKSAGILIGFIVGSMAIFYPLVSYNEKTWDESIGIIISENPFSEKIDSTPAPTNSTNTGNAVDSNYLPVLPEIKVGAGSGRVYIWQETINSIKERPITGYGIDTFTYYLNQDRPEKASGLGDPFIVIDKAHNMYLGLTMGAGIFALLGILILLVFVFFKGFVQTFKNKLDSQSNILKTALLLASLAFFAQGLFNDSILGVGTIAWVLFGIFVSVTFNSNTLENQ